MGYNPAKVEDGPAAKLWELLRQNPTFRRYAAYLLEPARKVEFGLWGVTSPNKVLSDLDQSNPIAAYALRWLFDPVFMTEGDVHKLLGADLNNKPMTAAAAEARDRLRNQIVVLFPYLEDDEIVEIICRGWDGFCATVPFYVLRRCGIFAEDNLQNVFGSAFKLGPILDVRDRTKYEGPLNIQAGNFTLDTPWCDAPELFRNHFAWLWCHFDFSAKNPYTGDRRFLPGPQSAQWLVKEIAEEPYYSSHKPGSVRRARIQYFNSNCDLFAFPKLLYAEPNIAGSLKKIEERLQSVISLHKRIVSKAKFNFLLGAAADWEAFIFCRPRVGYQLMNEIMADSTPVYKSAEVEIAAAILDWRKQDLKKSRKKSSGSHHLKKNQTHRTQRYLKMEAMMFSVFPVLDIESLILHSTRKFNRPR